MEFHSIKQAVAKKFEGFKGLDLYVVDVDKNTLWEMYLGSFPEGTNPMFRERTEHDCNCCKNYIRDVGNVVAINKDGSFESIWDIDVGGYYQVVADALSTLVKSRPIANVFLRVEATAGVDKNFEQTDGKVKQWNHFFSKIPSKFLVSKKDLGTKLGEARSSKDVFLRALTELTTDSIDTVLELIDQNSLYRGQEHKATVTAFGKLKKQFDKLNTAQEKDVFCWNHVQAASSKAILHVRNSVIGSLLVDLSEGKELEYAVKSFEVKVAPTNYKRPTGLATKSMITDAQKTIEELGLMASLNRRFATLDDITINNILYANSNAKTIIEGGNVFETLASKTSDNVKSFDKVEEVQIEKFLKDILPKANAIEVMFENSHANNLVSLIAPVDCISKPLFKWDNRFSWSYTGEVTDSIKERVKQAGGTVDAEWCNRLAWDYTDDLDLYMIEPDGAKIYFGNRRTVSNCGGMLDVDANGADGVRNDPAENIFYKTLNKLKPGKYQLGVHNYNRRSAGKGFTMQVEFGGQTTNIGYDKIVKQDERIIVAEFEYSKANGLKIVKSLPSSQTQREVWNLSTQMFHKVSVVMLSPNHWDDNVVGNKHYFFMLEGCLNDGQARPFFNEFLTDELSKHRKVLEMVGSKMKTDESINQLSGLGFSSTNRSSILVRVSGSFNRVIRVVF